MQPNDGCCGGSKLPVLGRIADADVSAFSEALSDVLRTYRLRDSEETCSFGITLTECYGLEALVRRGPLTLNEFADSLNLDKSTASRAAASLRRKRLATRGAHPVDGRALQLRATAAGKKLYEAIKRGSLACHSGLLEDYDPATCRAMTELLRRLDRAMRPAARTDRKSA
jgi:DNA-binding MarR family transcriptional regulator